MLTEALDLIHSIKVNYTNKKLETGKLEPIPLSDSTETSSVQKQLTYRPASGHSILRHAGTWEGDDFEEYLQAVYATRGQAKIDGENLFEYSAHRSTIGKIQLSPIKIYGAKAVFSFQSLTRE